MRMRKFGDLLEREMLILNNQSSGGEGMELSQEGHLQGVQQSRGDV